MEHSMPFKTADLCDQYPELIQAAEPIFKHYGRKDYFGGIISTVKVLEDNVLVRNMLEKNGAGKVLVVDGGGSMRCALLGDRLATLAIQNGWNGVLINGCIRDSKKISNMDIAVKALGTNPMKSIKKGAGEQDIPVRFAGVEFTPGDFFYADDDGVIISKQQLDKAD